jgi:CshA-type fibril repeat protein
MKKLAGALLTLALAFTGLAVQPASAAVILDANGVTLVFDEATSIKVAGTSSTNNRGKAAGDIVKYPGSATISGTTIDAVVKTVSVTSAVVDNYDGGSAVSNMDTLFQSDVTTTNAGSVVYEFSFYVTGTYTGAGTGTAVTLRNVYINSYDLDSSQNGNNQYTQFTGVQSYTLSNNTTIDVSASGNMLQFINGTNNASYSTNNGSYTKGRVQVKYDYLSTISIKIGTDNAGSGGGNFYALDFSVGLLWTEGSTTINTTSVQNSFNSPPTSANDAITAAASTAQFVTLSDFGTFADPDGNPWVDVKIVTLPTDGTLEFFNGSTWVAVTAGQNITADAIDQSKLRYTANSTATTDSLTFKVGDGLAYSTAAYTLGITVTGGASPSPSPSPSASVSAAQTITYAQPADQVLTTQSIVVAPSVDSPLNVTLTSNTTGVCTVSGYTITFATTGTCTTTATQAGDSSYSAATPVSRNFLIAAAQTPAPAAPAGPSLSPVSGTTLATTPITLSKPMNNGGSGSACLVDPADSVCKSSVTLPGKGTFTLNSDGTTKFVAVVGFYGTAVVQYRVTDMYGQSGQAPVTVTVTKPAAPIVKTASGTTLSTQSLKLSPAFSSSNEQGAPDLCLVDPADSVCKSSVTLPGKGTFTLNADGTVTFTPVKGFVGEAVVQLRATDKYGQSVEAPVTVTVSPVPGAQVGSTKGVTPIILKPVRASLKSAEICLIDVADQGCKTVVKAANVGTWRQAANGSVSFVAVAGYYGTTTVQQRVTSSGASTFNPYTVTVAKKRGPVTITISGFADGSPVMTAAIKSQVNAFLKAYADYRQVTCIGYTEGPTVLATDAALSRQRALNACAFVKTGLGKSLFVNKVRAGQDTVEAAQYRRITITLND